MTEQKSKTEKQKNLLQVGGIFVFLTIVALFFILGGGGEDEVTTSVEESTSGLNTSLPDPDDVYASDGKLEAVRKEQSRMSMEKNQQLAQNSSFDMLNSLNAPKDEKSKQVDVDELLSKIEDEVTADSPQDLAPTPKESSGSAGAVSSARTKGSNKLDSIDAAIRKSRMDDARRRVSNHLGTHADSVLLGLYVKPMPKPNAVVEKENSNEHAPQGEKTFNRDDINVKNVRKKGSIQAVIHGEQKNVHSSSQVYIRLLEPVTINGTTIPASTNLIGSVVFSENRVMITTESIKFNGDLYPFRGAIYDQDGMRGLYTGEQLVNDVAKESGKGAISESNQHFSGGNMVTKVTNTIIDGTKTVLEKAQRRKSVDLPANYKIFIKLE